MRNPYSRYKQFHGRQPRYKTRTNFHRPKFLIKLGKAVRIEYLTDKLNGGGDGTQITYYHDFETPVNLYMDEKGRTQLYLIGSKLKVTRAGIEN